MKIIILIGMLLFSNEIPWWINVPGCPLNMKGDELHAFVVISNHENKTVVEFSIGCIITDEGDRLKTTKIVEDVKGPIYSKASYASNIERMKYMHLKCGDSNTHLGIVKVLFDDTSVWEIGEDEPIDNGPE